MQPMVHRNLSMTPEIPRKDLSIVKSLNSTSREEQSNWEEMVGEAKYSCGNIHSECSTVSLVPGTEGEAEKSMDLQVICGVRGQRFMLR